MQQGGLYDVKQAARYLTISTQTIYKLIQENKLPASRLGTKHCIRLEEEDLLRFRRSRKVV